MLKCMSETLKYIWYTCKKLRYIRIIFCYAHRVIKRTNVLKNVRNAIFKNLIPLSYKLDIGLPPGQLPDLSIGTGDTSGMPHILFLFLIVVYTKWRNSINHLQLHPTLTTLTTHLIPTMLKHLQDNMSPQIPLAVNSK